MMKKVMKLKCALWCAAALLALNACKTPSPRPPAGVDGGPAKPDAPRTGGLISPATETVLERVVENLSAGNYDAALNLFDTIDSKEAAKSDIRLLKASVYLSAGKSGEAKAIAEEIRAAEPENVRALTVLAAVEGAAGKTREQKELLDRIIRIEPDNVEALVSLGNIANRASSYRTAGSYYDKALALAPGDGEALLGRSWIYRTNKDPKNAERLLTRAVDLYPSWAAPLHERGRLYKSAGHNREALADLDRAKAMDPGNYFIACDRGDALIGLNRKAEALEEFERAIAINPGYFLAYGYSAGIRDELKDYDGAIRDYEQVIRLNPDYYYAYEGLGILYMKKENWFAARDAFTEMFKRSRQDEITYGLLAALCWMKGGKPQDPKQFLEQVLRKAQRDSIEWWVLRLYHDLSGDADIAARIDKEKSPALKSRMLFYLAAYYDVRGNRNLADRFYLRVRELGINTILEWRLNEWALESRGVAVN
ncbi:MAG: tetratricopeptide repeat protein [Treponema sp.]|jgi:tetratricopeptide (TPR) repeat protein|nr:tetratricopeptide repeat protein [Treponema sp.]